MSQTKTQPLELGRVLITAGVDSFLQEQEESTMIAFVHQSLVRHRQHDWGVIDPDDVKVNEHALEHQARVMSSYPIPRDVSHPKETQIWVITEADRSSTTILFPSEY